MLTYPKIDPICLRFFGYEFYWYSVAYITGILVGLWLAKLYQRRYLLELPHDIFDRLVTYIIIGVLVGGRVGYVFLYAMDEFLANPAYLIEFPIRGMSFHGGFVGVAIAAGLFAYRTKTPLWTIADIICCTAPIGLFFGRIANFINGELYGRITDCWCGMVFPGGGMFPRHPSQLYEAILEGLVLFIVLNGLYQIRAIRERSGSIAGLFMMLYGSFRFIVEYAREPSDGYAIIGNLWLTWGQVYSLPMIVVGIVVLWINRKNASFTEL
ncbi:MAG: prolipoprotein diacylglyceryl transferase [Pseudomonadota bacterium]